MSGLKLSTTLLWQLLFLGVLGVVCMSVRAETPVYNMGASGYEEPLCMKDVKTEEDINVCQFATAKYFEIQVKDIEEKILSRFRGDQLERFKTAQDNWRALIENDCEIQSYFYEGAGIYTAIISQCLQYHYRSRLLVLNNYLCPEHSLLNGCADQTALNSNR